MVLIPFACSSDPPSDDGSAARGGAMAGAGSGAGAASGSAGSAPVAGSSGELGSAGQNEPGGAGGVGHGAGAGGAETAGAGGAMPTLPCDVEVVLEAKCQRCHRDPPENGAPFPLLSWADTQFEYGTQRVDERMQLAIAANFMPPTDFDLAPPVEPLTADERALLLEWLRSGAPPAFVNCEDE